MLKIIIPFLLLIISFSAFSAMEVSFEFSYDKSVYGANRENEQLTRTYTISVATYFWEKTALEFNFSNSNEIDDVGTDASMGNDIVLRNMYSTVESVTYGIGFRQAFASRKSFIRPLISIGYARQLFTSRRSFFYEDTGTGQTASYTEPAQKLRDDSIFITLSLQLNISRRIKLSGSVRSVFPAFQFNKAKDNLLYSLGMTWVF